MGVAAPGDPLNGHSSGFFGAQTRAPTPTPPLKGRGSTHFFKDKRHDRTHEHRAQSDAGYNAAQDRSLSAANNLGNLYNQTQQQQLAAAQALGSQTNADNQTALGAANGSVASITQALGLTSALADAQYAGVAPAMSALQAAASIPYTGVNNYAGLVNGLTGKYGNQTTNSTQTTSGNIGEMLGGLANTALSAYAGGGLGKLGGLLGGATKSVGGAAGDLVGGAGASGDGLMSFLPYYAPQRLAPFGWA